MLILNKNKKQFGKNSALHHVETNAIGADEYYSSYVVLSFL